MQDYEYFLSSIKSIKGIGKKTSQYFLKKKILNIFDLLWHMPTSKIETSMVVNINDLQIGKTQSIQLIPLKYNFPRVRNFFIDLLKAIPTFLLSSKYILRLNSCCWIASDIVSLNLSGYL